MGSAEEVKRNKRCLGFNGTKLCSYPNESQVWPCSEIAQPSHNALIITKHSGKSCAGTADLSKPLAHPVNTFTLTEATNASSPPHTHAGSSLQPNAHMSNVNHYSATVYLLLLRQCGGLRDWRISQPMMIGAFPLAVKKL